MPLFLISRECFSVCCLCDVLPEDFVKISCCINVVNVNARDDEKVVKFFFFVECGLFDCFVLIVFCVYDSFFKNLFEKFSFDFHCCISFPFMLLLQHRNFCLSIGISIFFGKIRR